MGGGKLERYIQNYLSALYYTLPFYLDSPNLDGKQNISWWVVVDD